MLNETELFFAREWRGRLTTMEIVTYIQIARLRQMEPTELYDEVQRLKKAVREA